MQHVDVKINDSVATILIRRPEVRGALDPVLIEDLQTAFGDVHLETKVRSVILTGGGNYFCSGLDRSVLDRIRQMDNGETPDVPDPAATEQWWTFWRSWTELVECMLRFPKPIIAAVDGPAVGAGFGLALACDMLVSSRRATYAAVAPGLGIPGGVTAALLHFRCGGSIASRWSMTGEQIDAETAAGLHLCDQPVASEQIWVEAKRLSDSIAESTPHAIASVKRLLNETIGESLLSWLGVATALDASMCTTPETKRRMQDRL